MQTITRSPSSIMLKSPIAWPTWRHRRLCNLLFSYATFSICLKLNCLAACSDSIAVSNGLVVGFGSITIAFISRPFLDMDDFDADAIAVRVDVRLGGCDTHAAHF